MPPSPLRREVAVIALAAFSLAIAACPRPAGADDQREKNEAAYARERDRLRRDFAGGPVVAIAGGEVIGGFDTLEAAAAAADARHPGATHRFLFRPGLEDSEESIAMSPRVDSPGAAGQAEMAGSWLQIGNGALVAKGLELIVASDVSVRYRGKETKFPRAPYARLSIVSPDGKSSRDASYVLSELLDRSVTVTEALATSLGLERFSIPGGARFLGTEGRERPYGKVRVRVRLRDVGFDEEMIAVVVPGRTVESALRDILATTEKIEVIPGLPADADATRLIDAPAEVKKIVDAAIASLVPAGAPAGWSWPNEVRFITKDGRRLTTSIGVTPGLFGVRLPEGTRSKDYRLSPELEAALRSHLAPR